MDFSCSEYGNGEDAGVNFLDRPRQTSRTRCDHIEMMLRAGNRIEATRSLHSRSQVRAITLRTGKQVELDRDHLFSALAMILYLHAGDRVGTEALT